MLQPPTVALIAPSAVTGLVLKVLVITSSTVALMISSLVLATLLIFQERK